jgi:cytochrome c-type biogenesis protein CcmF
MKGLAVLENLLLPAAAGLCLVSALLSFFPGKQKRRAGALPFLWCAAALLVMAATALMIYYLITVNCEYSYVYSHTSRDTLPAYRITALWSGQEGSFLLWGLIMFITGIVLLGDNAKGFGRSLGIFSAVCFVLLLLCIISQPFARLSTPPADGLGLNPALLDPYMTIHPPLVFIAYSAMAVLFSLVGGPREDRVAAATKTRRWVRISWFFLGVGILSGSVWAYRALGWGGYWAWDPIENAALVPWLILTGYLHRSDLSGRNVCILPFLLASVGVFLTRSGILSSMSAHAYAEGDMLISAIISCAVLGIAGFLVASKIKKARKKDTCKRVKININRILTYTTNAYAALIFLGTVAPVLLQAPTPTAYYTAISAVYALVYAGLLLAQDFKILKKLNIPMILLSTALTSGIAVLTRTTKYFWLFVVWAALMPLSLWLADRFRQSGPRYYLRHLGVLFMIVGAVASSAFSGYYYAAAEIDGEGISFEGVRISKTELAEKEMIIVTQPHRDLIIQTSRVLPSPTGGVIVHYTEKPLILLFWVGCALVAVPPCRIFSRKRKQSRDSRGSAPHPAFLNGDSAPKPPPDCEDTAPVPPA